MTKHDAYEWFECEDPDELAEKAFATADALARDLRPQTNANAFHAQLFSGRLEPTWGSGGGRQFDGGRTALQDNVIRQTINIATSIIASKLPRIKVLSTDAEWSDQRKARGLSKFLWGEMQRCGVYRMAPELFRDACIYGTTVAKVVPHAGRVRVERVLIDELLADDSTCAPGELPAELWHRQELPKRRLMAKYPEHAEMIAEASGTIGRTVNKTDSEKVVVVEVWRLPDGDAPGRHAIICSNCCLVDEEWTSDRYPLAFFHWEPPLGYGFYGQGIAEENVDVQIRLNHLNKFVQTCHDRIVTPRVYLDVASRLLNQQLTNEVGAEYYYRGNPPIFQTPTALGPETYNQIADLREVPLRRTGISAYSAMSLKPAGLESAASLREFKDNENNRFSIQIQRFEDFFKDIGLLMIHCAADLHATGEPQRTSFRGHGVAELVDWGDVDMDADRFVLTVEASSLLSMSPAARLEKVLELAQAGHLDKDEQRYLLGHPDLERSSSGAFADYEMTEKVIEHLEDGRPVVPESHWNLALLRKRIAQALTRLQLRDTEASPVPGDVLLNFDRFLRLVDDKIKAAAEATAQPAGAAPGAPQEPLGAAQAASAQGIPLEQPQPMLAPPMM